MIQIGNYRVTRADEKNLQVEHQREVTHPVTKETRMAWGFIGFYQDLQMAVSCISRLTEMDILEVSQDLEDFRTRLAKYADEVCNAKP